MLFLEGEFPWLLLACSSIEEDGVGDLEEGGDIDFEDSLKLSVCIYFLDNKEYFILSSNQIE